MFRFYFLLFLLIPILGCEPKNQPPIVKDNQIDTTSSIVTLSVDASDPENEPLTYEWSVVSAPNESYVRLKNASLKNPVFKADWRGVYKFRVLVRDTSKNVASANVSVSYRDGEIVDAWQELQSQIDKGGNGTSINLDSNKVYVLNSELNLRSFSNISITGNGATVRRDDAKNTTTALAADFKGGNQIQVTDVPVNYRIGDKLAIATGQSVDRVTINPMTIVDISGNTITTNHPFEGRFKAGATVLKSYNLIAGLPSHIKGGSNGNITIKDVVFDGNARNNQTSLAWMINGTITLHGGKTSQIISNNFYDISNENIIGHGVKVLDNEFDGLNGSAFHTSVHDKTKELNAGSVFKNNFVFNVNRIDKGINGHSEGAITFSWGAGNLSITDNEFISKSGNYGVMGVFAGASEHTDENLVFLQNAASNFEYLIQIVYTIETPARNILITKNKLHDVGQNDFTHLSGNPSIRIGCNIETGNTKLIVHRQNSSCK